MKPAITRWISTKSKLPSEGVPVLGFTEAGHQVIVWLYDEKNIESWVNDETGDSVEVEIMYWRPLPKPPKTKPKKSNRRKSKIMMLGG